MSVLPSVLACFFFSFSFFILCVHSHLLSLKRSLCSCFGIFKLFQWRTSPLFAGKKKTTTTTKEWLNVINFRTLFCYITQVTSGDIVKTSRITGALEAAGVHTFWTVGVQCKKDTRNILAELINSVTAIWGISSVFLNKGSWSIWRQLNLLNIRLDHQACSDTFRHIVIWQNICKAFI